MTIKTRVFNYVGYVKPWVVPTGVTQARFECWGAAGGLGTDISKVNPRVTAGGSAQPSNRFTNTPNDRSLGTNFANNAGYAAGTLNVSAGTTYYIAVGGNGQPGFSRIHPDGVVRNGDFVGGAGGWPDGGAGGHGWVTTQNLYNLNTKPTPTYTGGAGPAAATINETWLNTSTNLFYKCNATYSGGYNASKWTLQTVQHAAVAGASGGGGGGSTSILTVESGVNNRIMVAGGSGGSGGTIINDGVSAWNVQTSASDGSAISPPFGIMNLSTNPPLRSDLTWATVVDYLSSGMGIGGLGGATGTNNAATTNVDPGQPAGSQASAGGNGGVPSGLRMYSTDANHAQASAGGGMGGTGQSYGRAGVTPFSSPVDAAQNGDQNNSLIGNVSGGGAKTGSGGNGANGHNTTADDFNCGGGGGGGGYHGGGGGGAGYYGPIGSSVSKGGGGGGGSNFVREFFFNTVLTGGARPPAAVRNVADGAGGMGGFCRITYHAPPSCVWNLVAAGFDQSIVLPVQFRFNSSGADIYSFDIGYSAVLTDTVPTNFTTVLVDANSLVPGNTLSGTTHIAYNFPANTFTAGNTYRLFVRATDVDGKPGNVDPVKGTGNGDTSAWARSGVVAARAHSEFAGVTVTSPTAGATVPPGNVPVTWTVGVQTPLMAYRIRLQKGTQQITSTGWQPGGSRVNLAINPGFQTGNVWTSQGTNSNTISNADTTMPGVSTKNMKIAWATNADGTARAISYSMAKLKPGMDYRVRLGVGSGTANDTNIHHVAVLDPNFNVIQTHAVDLSATAANTAVFADFHFTMPAPHTECYIAIIPSDSTGSVGNSVSGRLTYAKDFLFEPGVIGDGAGNSAYTNPYFDGANLNGNTGTVSWVGTANASASILTGTNDLNDNTNLNCNTVLDGLTLYVDAMSSAGAQNGYYATTSQSLNVNNSQPVAPTVALVIDNTNGYMALTMQPDYPSANSYPTASLNVFRTDTATGVETRVGTQIKPSGGVALFQDVPYDGQAVTYRVEAVSTGGGTTSTTTGTVSTVG